MILEHDKAVEELIAIEGVLPLAIQTEILIESCSKNKEDLDMTDLEYNIKKVAIEADFSPK